MKIPKIIFIVVFLMFGCSSPKPFEVKDICAQPENTKAILQGYLSLPKMIDTIVDWLRMSRIKCVLFSRLKEQK